MTKVMMSKNEILKLVEPMIMSTSYSRLVKKLPDYVELEVADGDPKPKEKEPEPGFDPRAALVRDFNYIRPSMPDTEAGKIAAALLVIASRISKKPVEVEVVEVF